MKQGVALALAVCLTCSSMPVAFAQTTAPARAIQPGGDPWPRTVNANGATISIYQPQLNSWNGNQLDAYAAVKIKTGSSDITNYGVIWFTARTEVDKVNRSVTLANFKLTKQNFPTLANNGAAYTSAFQGGMPWTQSMPLDELETALATTSDDQEQKRVAVRNDPPKIVFSTTPAVLVSIDGRPLLRPSADGFVKVINTKALILADASSNTYYLALMDGWVEAKSINGPWSLAENPPAPLARIKDAAIADNQNQVIGNDKQSLRDAEADGEMPTVYVVSSQTELLLTQGDPEFASLLGTTIGYVTKSADEIFNENETLDKYYVLIGGRWFTTPSLQDGPWTYEPATSLPPTFAMIPDYGPKADVLVSVPGTPQAKEAIIEHQIPQTATISRAAAQITANDEGSSASKSSQASTPTYAGTP